MRFRAMKRRNIIITTITTSVVVWGGQTYVWNPFYLYYYAYPWYAMFWAFTLTWLVPHRTRKEALETPGLETLQEPEDAV